MLLGGGHINDGSIDVDSREDTLYSGFAREPLAKPIKSTRAGALSVPGETVLVDCTHRACQPDGGRNRQNYGIYRIQ